MANGDLIGQVLEGGYRIERRLGAGGMATVYLALQERLARPVVVKVPDPALLGDETFRTRFVREVRNLVRLKHPHIVTVLDAGDLNGTPYAVMEYREGGSLRDRLDARAAQGRCERPDEVLDWLVPVAAALDHIHEEDVVHRDVKPGNILFDAKGHACLSDFGIAKALGSLDTGITRANATPGSPAYMAPEAAQTGEVAGRSDQYSLAAIVYEALSGRRPIEGETPIALMVKKITDAPRDLAEIAEDLPPQVAASVMRALHADPEDRFPTCGAFARAFSDAAGAPPESGPADETGTLAIADLRGAAPSSEETRTYVRERPPPAPRVASALARRRVLVPVAATLLLLLFAGGLYLFGGGPEEVPGRYDPGVRERFFRMAEGEDWRDAREDERGMLTVAHARTGLVFVLVPGGRFRMGSTDGAEDELPVHEVTVRAFLLAKTECTQAAWDRIGGEDDREWTGADLPIESVSWEEATAWCRRAKLRLPSEAEWEYACRAGSVTKWCYGYAAAELGQYAQYQSNSTSTREVGGRRPNAWGFFDMHGNVAEWCEDDGHESYEGAPDDGSAWTDGTTKERACRGGAFDANAESCRSATRFWIGVGYRLLDVGFRPAFSLP